VNLIGSAKLGDVVTIVRGISYKSDELVPEGGLPMVNLRNVGKGGGFRVDGTKYFSGQAKATQILETGDLLISNTDLSKAKDVLGSPFLLPAELSGSTFSLDLSKLVVREELILRKYLYYFLQSPTARDFMKANGQGITVMHLRMRGVPELELPLPKLDVQQRIVEALEDHLSRLDKALAEVDEGRRRAELLVRSIRRDVFSPEEVPSNWLTTNLGNVLAPINGKRLTQRGWSPQCLNHARQSDDQWGVLKTTAIQLGDFQPQHHKELPATFVAKPEIEVVQGDLIMTATGPRNRCGVPCLVTATPSRLMMSGKMFRVRTNAAVCDPRWLLEFLLSDAGQTQLESLKVGSSDSSVSIGADLFERIEMLLPPLNVQLEILGDLDESVARTRAFARAIESTSAQTETLRRSVLHAGFTGQLTNEETND